MCNKNFFEFRSINLFSSVIDVLPKSVEETGYQRDGGAFPTNLFLLVYLFRVDCPVWSVLSTAFQISLRFSVSGIFPHQKSLGFPGTSRSSFLFHQIRDTWAKFLYNRNCFSVVNFEEFFIQLRRYDVETMSLFLSHDLNSLNEFSCFLPFVDTVEGLLTNTDKESNHTEKPF